MLLALLIALQTFAADYRYSSVTREADGRVIVHDPVYVAADGTTYPLALVANSWDNNYRRQHIYFPAAFAICEQVARLPKPSVTHSSNNVFSQYAVLDRAGRFSRFAWREFGSSENAYSSDELICSR